jgi:hypothetical protein
MILCDLASLSTAVVKQLAKWLRHVAHTSLQKLINGQGSILLPKLEVRV